MFSCEYFWVDYGCEYIISYCTILGVGFWFFVCSSLPMYLPLFLSPLSAVSFWSSLVWFRRSLSSLVFCFYFRFSFCREWRGCREGDGVPSSLPSSSACELAPLARRLRMWVRGAVMITRHSWVVESLETGAPLTSVLYSALFLPPPPPFFFFFFFLFSSLPRLRVYFICCFVCPVLFVP
jgi:hypothetical protein